jgi:hypothetical protein
MVPRPDSIIRQEYRIAASRESERHQPVRLLAEESEGTAVNVEERRTAGSVPRLVHVEEVAPPPGVAIRNVPDELDPVAAQTRLRVQVSDSGAEVQRAIPEPH